MSKEILEPILHENNERFVLFPIQHNKIWEMYKQAEGKKSRLIAVAHFKQKFSEKKAKKKDAKKTKLLEE